MLNFGASKPRVRGGARAPGPPPWIRTCIRKNNFLHWLDMDPSSHTFTDFVYVYLIATKKRKRKIGHTWSFLWIVSRDLFAPRTIFPLTHNGADFKVHAMSFAIYSGKIHCAYLESSDKCYSTRKYPMRILNHCVTPLSKTLWQILNDYYSGWMPNTFCYECFQQIVSIMITFYKLPCVLSFTLFQLVIPNCRNYKLLLCLLWVCCRP